MTLALVRTNHKRQPSAKIVTAMRRFAQHRIDYNEVDPGQWIVAGRYAYWPETDYWRALDNSAQGYTLSKLIDAVLSNAIRGALT